MLNKNDPLIGAVQEVMKRNHAEREAARLVNEKFGVTDRKALPHEKQGAWDAAYKHVLSEGLHPNQQKLDVHEPEKDKLTKHDFKMLRAKKKSMEEATDGDTTSPSSMGIKKPDYAPAGTTPDYAKPTTQTVNRAAKTSLPTGTMKEAKVNPYAVGMAAVKKSTGDQPPMEKKNIMKAHKIAKKIIAKKKMKIDEGFNNRHGLSVTASAEKQTVTDQLNEAGINPALVAKKPVRKINDTGVRRPISGMNNVQTRLAKLRAASAKGQNAPLDARMNAKLNTRTDKTTEFGKTVDSILVPFAGAKQKFDAGDKKGAAIDAAIDVATYGLGGPAARLGKKLIDKGTDAYRAFSKTSQAMSKKTAQSVPQIAAQGGSSGRLSPSGPWGSIRKADSPPSAGLTKNTSPSGTFAARLQASRQATPNAAASNAARVARATARQGTPNAAASNAARITARQRLAQAGSKAVNAVRNNPKMAAGAAAGAALGGFAATKLGNVPPATQATTQQSPGVTARKIEATPRKVSDTEIMNAPQYKQAVKAVGGPEGARKIQPGTDVAGVGKVEKGETIWSKVKSQLEKQPVKGFEMGANKGGAGR